MANRTVVQNILSGVAAGLDGSSSFVASPGARLGMGAAALLLRGVASAVSAHGTDAVRKAVLDLAGNPPKRASLDAARDAVAETLAARGDAPEAGEEDEA